MATALAQQQRRTKLKRLKRCLWCPRRCAPSSTLCIRCGMKHRLKERISWEKKRKPGAKLYRCVVCGKLGHNARRHK